jgi:hypothetical protein
MRSGGQIKLYVMLANSQNHLATRALMWVSLLALQSSSQ